jgi:hypothetical protein
VTEKPKRVESLTAADLAADPVWHYENGDELGDTLVRAVKRLPVKSLVGKVVGARVCLANGANVWALIGNIDARNPRLNEHFLTLSVERNGKWFALARYHDIESASRSPQALSQFLGVPIDEVFPITFDIREFAQGDPAALAGSVQKEPRGDCREPRSLPWLSRSHTSAPAARFLPK